MKKIIFILMASIMVLSLFALVSCNGNSSTENGDEKLKLGLGVYTETKASDATEDKNGQGQATVTVAAVLVDDDGKVVKAFIDCADSTVSYTYEGKAIANSSFKTKYEAGRDYGMTNPLYGGTSTKEWYEQADIFCGLVVGKTAAEIKALVADGSKGNDEVIGAGCTIMVEDFVKAIDKAIANATASNATKNDPLRIGTSTTQTTKDATDEVNGSNKVESTFVAAAINADGKIVAMSSDCVEVSFSFDEIGASTFNTSKAVLSKKEQGSNYGMTNPLYGGTSTKEWFEQAAVFDAACIGKTVSEISSLIGDDGKGNSDLQSAGCTISVSGFVKAAEKLK
ncbi:MAG: hypothetical protein IJW65_03360 [Clostridia bacterium]|nr:hypothetical protein [Clostridia bacterium]